MPNLWLVFTTGLLTGGLTCMAVQGSLLAAALLSLEENGRLKTSRQRILVIGIFLVSKLIAYTILGAALGWLGSFLVLSLKIQVLLSIAVIVFMLGSAGNILELHPLFRYFSISPPRFLWRYLRGKSRSADIFTPLLLGTLTVLVPCGTTQAMMMLAVGTGNFIGGALVMGVFVLGTIPIFFALGYGLATLKEVFQAKFRFVAAMLITIMALWNINTILILTGTDWNLQGIIKKINCAVSFCDNNIAYAGTPSSETTITINSRGYEIDNPVISSGSEVTVHLVNTDGANCAQSFTIPSYNIQKVVPVGQKADFSFKAPVQPGRLAFMCSMGMYRGEFIVK